MNERAESYTPNIARFADVGYLVPANRQGYSSVVGTRYSSPRNYPVFGGSTVAIDRWTWPVWTSGNDCIGQDDFEMTRLAHHWRTAPITLVWLISVAVICLSMGILQATGVY